MSKASDHAAAIAAMPRWKAANGYDVAKVTEDGDLLIFAGGGFTRVGKDSACSLARWIIDTFGEGESA